jgi:hypothetical protein
MAQVCCLVNNAGGDTLVFVSGSCVHLPDLCFGKAPNPFSDGAFPSYQGTVASLDSKRTGVRTLGPITYGDDMVGYLRSLSSPAASAIAAYPRELASFVLATGGIRRSMNEYLCAWNGSSVTEPPVSASESAACTK